MVLYPTDSCAIRNHYRWRVRLQDCLHGGVEFSFAFKVNYISEDFFTGNGNFSLLLYTPEKTTTAVFKRARKHTNNTATEITLTFHRVAKTNKVYKKKKKTKRYSNHV